jgi:hypothetical protein
MIRGEPYREQTVSIEHEIEADIIRPSKRGGGVMPTSQQSWVKFLYVGVIGWIWIAASLVAVYFLVRAIFFDDKWWHVIASVAVAWFLYKVTLYYQLEKTG